MRGTGRTLDGGRVQCASVQGECERADNSSCSFFTTSRGVPAGARMPYRFDHAVLDDCATAGLAPAKTHWARPIDTPPYFGYTLKPGITFT